MSRMLAEATAGVCVLARIETPFRRLLVGGFTNWFGLPFAATPQTAQSHWSLGYTIPYAQLDSKRHDYTPQTSKRGGPPCVFTDAVGAGVTCVFVALSRFTIRNGMDAEVREAFVGRPHLVDTAAGFLGMEVMSPVESVAEIWLLTRWTDEQSYRTWHRSHSYSDSHSGIPKGLKLVPGSAEIRLFNVFAD